MGAGDFNCLVTVKNSEEHTDVWIWKETRTGKGSGETQNWGGEYCRPEGVAGEVSPDVRTGMGGGKGNQEGERENLVESDRGGASRLVEEES